MVEQRSPHKMASVQTVPTMGYSGTAIPSNLTQQDVQGIYHVSRRYTNARHFHDYDTISTVVK